ncbi:hypothetical protein PALB_25480 [Pseudoalteromonas luteoviolacea B = ATCC 29581]|nr:hypothetical protein PALB_25480 [Pseudoalteromonas luteoviolacea B = ATCC 29581]
MFFLSFDACCENSTIKSVGLEFLLKLNLKISLFICSYLQ